MYRWDVFWIPMLHHHCKYWELDSIIWQRLIFSCKNCVYLSPRQWESIHDLELRVILGMSDERWGRGIHCLPPYSRAKKLVIFFRKDATFNFFFVSSYCPIKVHTGMYTNSKTTTDFVFKQGINCIVLYHCTLDLLQLFYTKAMLQYIAVN